MSAIEQSPPRRGHVRQVVAEAGLILVGVGAALAADAAWELSLPARRSSPT